MKANFVSHRRRSFRGHSQATCRPIRYPVTCSEFGQGSRAGAPAANEPPCARRIEPRLGHPNPVHPADDNHWRWISHEASGTTVRRRSAWAIASRAGIRAIPDVPVAAVFDTADGIVAGQQVKVAGAVVGSVHAVDLAPGPKARIRDERRSADLAVPQRCDLQILPEGLDQRELRRVRSGSPRAPRLGGSGGLPTVPLAHTTDPTSLQDLMNASRCPSTFGSRS